MTYYSTTLALCVGCCEHVLRDQALRCACPVCTESLCSDMPGGECAPWCSQHLHGSRRSRRGALVLRRGLRP